MDSQFTVEAPQLSTKTVSLTMDDLVQRGESLWARVMESSMYPALTLAQVALTIVSAVTTYGGFLLVLKKPWLSALAAFGLQSLVFWLPRRLQIGRPYGRLLRDGLPFAFSFLVSVLFSYQAFVDGLVPSELQERRSAAVLHAQGVATAREAIAAIDTAVASTEVEARRFDVLAKREYNEGGTSTRRSTRPGRGPLYRDWRSKHDTQATRLETLRSIQKDAHENYDNLMGLPSEGLDSNQFRVQVVAYVNEIVTLAQDRLILDALFERGGGQAAADQVRKLKPPEEEQVGQPSSSAAVRDQFMRGIIMGYEAFTDVWTRHELDRFHVGAFVALFVASVIDILVVFLGYYGKQRSMSPSLKRVLRDIGEVGTLVRSNGRLAIRVKRDSFGAAPELQRKQDLAIQALLDAGHIHLERLRASVGSDLPELLILGPSAISTLVGR